MKFLQKEKRRCRLKNLPSGCLFTTNGRNLIVKSEYRTNQGFCQCYIVGSGEVFWGGQATVEEVNNILVYPVHATGAF